MIHAWQNELMDRKVAEALGLSLSPIARLCQANPRMMGSIKDRNSVALAVAANDQRDEVSL